MINENNVIPFKKIKEGDCIGIFSSSSPTNDKSINKIKEYFSQHGYRVKVAKHTLSQYGYMAGSKYDRANDLNQLIRDDDVNIIMTANGGRSAIQLLNLIDYDALKDTKKGIIGLSDPSIILNAITTKTSLVTIHGPNGYNFGDTTISNFSEKYWWNLVTGNLNINDLIPLNNDIKILREGNDAVGKLVGGHLGTIRNLIGTPWEPNWDNKILFIEEAFTEYSAIDTYLTYLDITGVLKRINGLVVGQLFCCNENNYSVIEKFEEIILRNCEAYDFPIISNVLLGHTDDKITLPIGAQVKLSTKDRNMQLISTIVC